MNASWGVVSSDLLSNDVGERISLVWEIANSAKTLLKDLYFYQKTALSVNVRSHIEGGRS
jgi:hypothetical protein